MEENDLPPVRFWGLDPLFWAHRKMFVQELLHVKEHPDYKGVFCQNGHPLTKAEIMGYIVSLHEKERLITYGVDDGTGTLSCCHWQHNEADTDRLVFHLGELVSVQGKISTFRNERQLTVDLIYAVNDPNAETLFWLDTINLNKTAYNQPSSLPQGLERPSSITLTMSQLVDKIRDLIRETKSTRFEFRYLCSEKSIKDLAREILDANEKEGKNDSQAVSQLIRKAVSLLEKEGFLYYKNNEQDIYEVITHEQHLRPAILNAIQHLSQSQNDGVHIARICDTLRSTHKFRHVSQDQILNSLDQLVCNSDVYQPRDRYYCMVD